MKKFILICFVLVIGFSTYGQTAYGPKAGVTLSNWSIDPSTSVNQPDGMKTGILFGFYFQKQFASEFFIQGQLDYRTFVGGYVSNSSLSADVGGSNIYIPLTFGSALSYNFKWYAGAALAMPLEVDEDGFDQFATSGTTGGDTPLDLMVGVNIGFSQIIIDAGYYFGMTAVHRDNNVNWKTGQIVFSIGYNLGEN